MRSSPGNWKSKSAFMYERAFEQGSCPPKVNFVISLQVYKKMLFLKMH